jgi:hypothetical protein
MSPSPSAPEPMAEPSAGAERSPLTYVLPIKSVAERPADTELAAYIRWLTRRVRVIVADGSPPEVFESHARLWGPGICHLPVRSETLNGKVAGVCDGVAAASSPHVIIADDDVRYDDDALGRLAGLLSAHDAVIPQNYFDPTPWHARWDTGRTLLNRAFGSDFAGTMAVRREAFLAIQGYCGAVLFENLELIRSLTACGYDIHHADDIFVSRRPPTTAHFRNQRLRQAYDSRAQPGRWLVELSILPLILLAARYRRTALLVGWLATVAAAETGRRRHGGTRAWSPTAALWSPAWAAERAATSWLALVVALRGGVWYSDRRLRTAAHSTSVLRTSRPCPEHRCRCAISLRSANAA